MTDTEPATLSAEGWFPTTTGDTPGWRLDIVSLLAVIGESSLAEHSQAMTASWTCCLPRIIPAPQVLLKPTRPTRMPQIKAAVVGVKNGTYVEMLNYFANIIHPIEELSPFEFKVFNIRHSPKRVASIRRASPTMPVQKKSNGHSHRPKDAEAATSTATEQPSPGIRHRTSTGLSLKKMVPHSNPNKLPPHVPVRRTSPLNILSIVSFAITWALFAVSVYDKDGIACLALGTIGLASSIVGYASKWSPQLMKRNSISNCPPGDVVIRTREGAFIVVHCDENVARELYTGTEECIYTVDNNRAYRALVGIGTFLVMVSVVLLGNCNFNQQAAIGGSYIVLNGFYWGASLVSKDQFWDMSLYEFEEVTNPEGRSAHLSLPGDDDPADRPSYTRTLWYAIRETKEVGWLYQSDAIPRTTEWDKWLKEAEENARTNEKWEAVRRKDELVGQTDTTETTVAASANINGIEVIGGQHAPPYASAPFASMSNSER